MAIGMSTLPLGMIGYGYLLEATSLQTTLIFLASVNLLLPVAMVLMPALRMMETPAEAMREPLSQTRTLRLD